MKALLWKDFYATKSSIIFMAVLVAAMMGIGAYAGGESGLFSVYSVLFISMMPFTSQALDERAQFPRFVLSTPISRKELVLSKYVYGLLLALLVLALNLGDLFLLHSGTPMDVLPLLLTVSMALLAQGLIMPLLFRFGAEKARIALIAILALFAGSMAFLVTQTGMDLTSLLPAMVTQNAPWIVLGVALLYGLSIAVSLQICKKRDFS